jgi:protoheme ferro-lyase
VSDHIETTYEMGMLFRETARKAGITDYHVVRSLNDHAMLGNVFADLVTSRLADLDSQNRI